MKKKKKSKKSTPYIRERTLDNGEIHYLAQVFTGRYLTGKPQFAHKTFTTKTDAEAYVHQTLADRTRGVVLTKAGRVSELLDDMLREKEILGRKNLPGARRVVELHLRPYFGATRIDHVTSDSLAEYILRKKAEGLAPATINNQLAGLRHAFNLGYRATPPKVARVPYFRLLRVNNARRGFFEAPEYEALFAQLPPDLRPLLCYGYFTGCRRAEVLLLEWRQVDLDRGLVRLDPGTTKNDEARTIPLVPQLLEVLRMQRSVRDEYWPRCPWVFFWHATGTRVKSFRDAWSQACQRAGLWDAEREKPTKLFHDLRRSAVRNMERAGVPRKVAMQISGHKTESIYRRYNIVDESDLRESARRLGEYTRQQTEERAAAEKPQPPTATVQ
jgi:integrase